MFCAAHPLIVLECYDTIILMNRLLWTALHEHCVHCFNLTFLAAFHPLLPFKLLYHSLPVVSAHQARDKLRQQKQTALL